MLNTVYMVNSHLPVLQNRNFVIPQVCYNAGVKYVPGILRYNGVSLYLILGRLR